MKIKNARKSTRHVYVRGVTPSPVVFNKKGEANVPKEIAEALADRFDDITIVTGKSGTKPKE